MASQLTKTSETETGRSFTENSSSVGIVAASPAGMKPNSSAVSGEGSILGGPQASPAHISHENRDPLEALRQRLRKIGVECAKPKDSVLNKIESIKQKHDNQNELDDLDRRSKSMQEELKQQIRKAKEACKQESNVLTDLASKLETLENKRKSLVKDIENLDTLHSDLKDRIALHKDEASQEIEEIDLVEEERKRQVPRLKTQISLYATTTGIKWDYSDDQTQSHILSGQVVCIESLILLLRRHSGNVQFAFIAM